MDEMTHVKRLWADKPEPDRQDLAPLRASLLQEARRPRGSLSRGRAMPRRALPRLALAGVLAAAVTAGLVVFLPGAAPASAQEVLRRAAEAAGEQPDLKPGPEQYVYTRFQNQQTQIQNGRGEVVHGVEERWEPAVGPKRWLMRERETGRADAPGLPHARFPYGNRPNDSLFETDCERAPGGALTYAGMASVTPAQLRARVAAGGPDVWSTISRLIRTAAVRPSVTPELYKIAAEVPGIKLIPETVDAAGRPGIGVAREDGGYRQEMIFDRETYRYLGDRLEVLDAKRQTGANPKMWLIAVNSSALVAVDVAGGLPRLAPGATTSKIPC
ncbi:CU044_5270 family protein [Nonomuraea sp. NPDC050394]|uniref:CU044_5270 family protein n=1 Tax=Nonomuraea sp. NPDC050394 TaxID=3364363 RepID=UPI0037AC287D